MTGDTVRVCPECDTPDIRVRPGGYNSSTHRVGAARWRCKDCGATFDEPAERPSNHAHAGLSGLARDLADADPDDLRADGGAEQIPVCPQCGETGVYQRQSRHTSSLDPSTPPWHCSACGHDADAPDWRAPVKETGLSGLAHRLAEADPDDLRADGGRTGGWVLVGSTWHRSVEFDGYIHGCRCGCEFDSWSRWTKLGTVDEEVYGSRSICSECDDRELRADGGGYPCALCDARHDSLEAALQCCGDRLDEPNPDGDLWTCDRCGEFATERCRDDEGTYCLWCRERVETKRRRQHDSEQEVRPDGGRGTCSHCGATLPEEIDEGAGVYCTECGHGQLVTDGGGSRHPDDQRIIDAMERQADALERLADEQRYQSVALTELVGQLNEVAAAVDDFHQEPRENARRSNRALQTILEDHDHERREAADDVRRKLPDGGVETQAALVDGPVPDECTTKQCHGTPEWAVRHGDGVSRQHGDSASPGGPPDGAVAPYVCDDCRRERYPTIDADDWVRVAASDGGRSDLDQQLGSLLEAWTTRDVPSNQCRFCNEQLFEPVDDPAEQFCDCDCADAFETVLDTRIALGNRDLHQRGYD
jgi:transposase-like protein